MEQLRASIIAARTPPKMPEQDIDILIGMLEKEKFYGLLKEVLDFKRRRVDEKQRASLEQNQIRGVKRE